MRGRPTAFPFRQIGRLFRVEVASGVLLLVATAVALACANSRWSLAYQEVWRYRINIRCGHYGWTTTPHFVVNEILMMLFFVFAGLEIRRELHHGVLSGLRQAAVPVAAALGGVIVPAMLYLVLAAGPDIRRGWAVPTATDIAFAIGVLAILGKRVPNPVRVLLLSLAIIDDIVAVLLIAVVYSSGFNWMGMLIALSGIVLVLISQRLGIRAMAAYALPAAILWSGIYAAGIHPALGGIVLGLLAPVGPHPRRSLPSLERIELTLHPWVAYGIMPLFAFANAGVHLEIPSREGSDSGPLAAAIVLALVLGKPLGILGGTWLAIQTRLAVLPDAIDWRGVMLVGLLGGIGFTMSILIADLAFGPEPLLATAKLAILCGSALAAAAGLLLGRFWLFRRKLAL